MDLKTYLMKHIQPRDFYADLIGYEGSGSIICPFHKEKNPSLSIDIMTGSAYCYGCKKKLHNIVDFLIAYRKISLAKAMYELFDRYVEPLIPSSVYFAAATELKEKTSPYHWLTQRGIGKRTIRQYWLGWTGSRLAVPVFNEWGYCCNMKLFATKKSIQPKVISYDKGYGKPRVYPYTALLQDIVYLFEGEMDTLLAIHLGLNAATVGGANSWRSKFTNSFLGKRVYICYDNDSAGKAGALTVAKDLKRVASEVRIVDIPQRFGKDFTEYIHNRPLEAFLKRVRRTQGLSMSLTEKYDRADVDFAQQETMVVPIKQGVDMLHIMLKIEPDRRYQQ